MKRILELDGLRGLAAVLVVLFHAFPQSIFFWGWSGVDLFFVLSGFLITTIILTQQHTDGFLRSFYLRRIFRIWPVYYLTLAGVLLVNHFSATGFPTTGLLNHFFFLQNCQRYLGLSVPTFIGPFWPSWSVAVEEQFYLLWPLLILSFGRRSIPFFCAALLIVSLGGRYLVATRVELLATRGDGLAMGCFLAWLADMETNNERRRVVRSIVWAAGVVGGIYVLSFFFRFWMSQSPAWTVTRITGFSLLYFSVVGLCVLQTGHLLLAPLRIPLLRWFGTISYAMYLLHEPILTYCGTILDRIGVHSPVVHTTATWLLIVGLPAASWYLLERPILRWKEQFVRLPPENLAVLKAAPNGG